MTGRVLILGASGRFGRHAADAFWNAGWRVRQFDRDTDELMQSAKDVDVIVNAWNPQYTEWADLIPDLTARVIEAAQASGATVIIPGNVYVFGEGSGPALEETTPHLAKNPLGRIRVEMEAEYRKAGVRTIVLRAGDFIDTEASGNWFDLIIAAKSGKGQVVSPGTHEASHAWAYLPDMARAAEMLARKRNTLATFEVVNFPGYALSLNSIAELVSTASGKQQSVKSFNWLALWLAYPFWPMGRKLLEMRYLWRMPHYLSRKKFDELLPSFRDTDPLIAVNKAIAHLDIDPDQSVAGRTAHIAAE